MSLSVGQPVTITSRTELGWYKGFTVSGTGERGKKGIFPCNYITVDESNASAAGLGGGEEGGEGGAGGADGERSTGGDMTKHTDAVLLSEVMTTIKEWTKEMRSHLSKGEINQYEDVQRRVGALLEWRGILNDPDTPPSRRTESKASIIKVKGGAARRVDGACVCGGACVRVCVGAWVRGVGWGKAAVCCGVHIGV